MKPRISRNQIVKSLLKAYPDRIERVLNVIVEDYGPKILLELVFAVPGYMVNAAIINRLDFAPDLWRKLYNKKYFMDKGEEDYWTDIDNARILPLTSHMIYFKALNDKVVDKQFFLEIRRNFVPDGKPSADSFELLYEDKYRELSNARDFIMRD